MGSKKDFIFRLIGETRGMEQMNQQAKKAGINLKTLAIRAAAVIPTWILLRSTILALPRALSEATKEWLSFQTEMSRVTTVTRGSAKAIDILENSIKNIAATSKTTFKDTASAVYALGSAGLNTAQQLGGLEHVMNVAIGTGGNVEQTAKLMSGAFNVFGRKLKDATTDAQRFKKIADTIAYTYSTQQIELAELATAMGYVASVGSLVEIQFEELVATIGVLNTGMLKGSKSGTSLVNAFIQLANKSERLSEIGIHIDTSQPLKFLDVMDKLYLKFGATQLSLSGLQKIMSVFGIRGGRAVGLLLTNFKFFKDSIKKTGAEAEDFAEIMKTMAEDNIPAVAQKIKNSFGGIWQDVLNQWEPAFMQFLKKIQGALDDFRASETVRQVTGGQTRAQGIAQGVPQVAGGAVGLLAARGLPGIQNTFGQNFKRADAIEAKSVALAQKNYDKIANAAPKGLRDNYDTRIAAAKASPQSSAAYYRASVAGGPDIPKAMTGIQKTGAALRSVGKYALGAYAGLKLMQGAMNSLAPNSQYTKDFNAFMDNLGETVRKGLMKIGDAGQSMGRWLGSNSLVIEEIWRALMAYLKDEVQDIGIAFTNLGTTLSDATYNIVHAFDPFITLFELINGIDVGKNLLKLKEQMEGVIKGEGSFEVKNTPKQARSTVEPFVDRLAEILVRKDLRDKVTDKGVGDGLAEDRDLKEEQKNFFKATQKLQDLRFLKTDAGLNTQKIDELKAALGVKREEQKEQSLEVAPFFAKIDKLTEKALQLKPDDKEGSQQVANDLVKTYNNLDKRLDEIAKIWGYNEKQKAGLKERFIPSELKGVKTDKDAQTFSAIHLLQLKDQDKAKELTVKGDAEDALLTKFKSNLQAVYDTFAIKQLKLFDVSDTLVATKELQVEIDKINTIEDLNLQLSDFMVENSEKLTELGKTRADIQEKIVTLQQKGLDITIKQQQEILKTGQFARDAFKDVFLDAFQTEESDFQSMAKQFGDAIKSQFQENFANILGDAVADLSGTDSVFGNFFNQLEDGTKALTNPIAKAHLDGITRGANVIIKAHQDGMSGGGGSSTYSGVGGSGAIGKALNSLLGPTSTMGKALNTPIFSADINKNPITNVDPTKMRLESVMQKQAYGLGASKPYQVGGGTTGSFYDMVDQNVVNSSFASATGQTLPAGSASAYKNTSKIRAAGGGGNSMTYGQALGGVANVAMTGYSAYQSAGGGTEGAVSGALMGIGSGLAMFGGPVGMVIGGAMMLASSFIKKPEDAMRPDDTSRVVDVLTASKVEQSNQQLQIVNRNLVALRQVMEFVLPDSAYFSEKENIEDNFSINARRGLT